MENQFGKTSRLRLTACLKDGKTILKDAAFTAPFKVMHPFYENKDFMTVMLISVSAGIMAGDCQVLNIKADEGAKLELISQSYEKIHRMGSGYAQRKTSIEIASGACLHYTPLPVIPFAGSDFRAASDIRLADDTSELVYSEVLACGRAAHGEEFLYNNFQNKVSIYQGKTLVYRDNSIYRPGQVNMSGYGMYEGFTHLANIIICNKTINDNQITAIRLLMESDDRMEGGITLTTYGHTVIRILGKSGQALTEMIRKITDTFE